MPQYRSALAGNLLLSMALVFTLQACATRAYYETPPQMPQALEPVNASELANGVPVQFTWQASETAEHYDFHIFDRTTGDIRRYYMAALRPEAVCAGSQCSVTVSLDMPSDTSHAWRVRASNSAGNSAWTRKIFKIN